MIASFGATRNKAHARTTTFSPERLIERLPAAQMAGARDMDRATS
jgi:hypothetical protein